MISQVSAAGPWLNASGGSQTAYPYVPSSANPMVGVVRVYNGRLDCFDGTAWVPMYQNSAYIDMSDKAKVVLMWAERKMREEEEIKRLAEMHPAVTEAVEMLKHAEERLQVVVQLAKEN